MKKLQDGSTQLNQKEILKYLHITSKVPTISKLTELSRSEWDELTDKFINIPSYC